MKRIWGTMITVLLMGCASLKTSHCVALAPGVEYCLASSEQLADLSLLQRVDLMWGQRKDTVLVRLETADNHFTMAVFSPLGQRLVQLRYAPPNIIVEGAVPAQLDPVLMAAWVQLSIWPSERVRQGLRGQFEWDTAPNQRVLKIAGQTVFTAVSQGDLSDPGRIRVHLPLQQVDMHIQTLRETPEP